MNTDISALQEYLPFLIPLAILQLILMLTALIMIIRQTHFRYLNKPAWIIIVVFVNLFGPILYFVLEKRS